MSNVSLLWHETVLETVKVGDYLCKGHSVVVYKRRSSVASRYTLLAASEDAHSCRMIRTSIRFEAEGILSTDEKYQDIVDALILEGSDNEKVSALLTYSPTLMLFNKSVFLKIIKTDLLTCYFLNCTL